MEQSRNVPLKKAQIKYNSVDLLGALLLQHAVAISLHFCLQNPPYRLHHSVSRNGHQVFDLVQPILLRDRDDINDDTRDNDFSSRNTYVQPQHGSNDAMMNYLDISAMN